MAVRTNLAQDALAMVEYGDGPSVLILSDSSAGFARARRAAELAGARVGGEAFIEGAAERLDRQVATGAVLVDVDRDHGDALDRLLERIDHDVRAGRHNAVIETPAALIDTVAARAPHARQLCNASEAERVNAIALALVREPGAFHDVNRNGGSTRLQQLSEEVGRIASILASLSPDELSADPLVTSGEESPLPDPTQIRAVIRARRLRDQYFNSDIFADPAWDMLLDLMVARVERRKVAVSSLCIAAAVPATTALRWIKALTDSGLFVRHADPEDGRRVFIELSEQAAAAMTNYFRALQRIAPLSV